MLRPGSDQLGARLPGSQGGQASGPARREVPSGSTGLRKRRRKSLEGSQQPLQVGGLGREEPGHSAGEGGPSAKTLWRRPQSGPAHPHSLGAESGSFKEIAHCGHWRGQGRFEWAERIKGAFLMAAAAGAKNRAAQCLRELQTTLIS